MKKLTLILILFAAMNAQAFNGLGSGKTFLKSAILPGWGELELDQHRRAVGFFQREGVLWLALFGGLAAEKWYESDFKAFGSQHAGVDMANKSYQFAVDMGNYDSFEEFQAAKDRQREVDLKYPENAGYEWEWDSTGNRQKFEDMRISSGTAGKFASFAVAGLVAHRFISLIDVLYLNRISDKMGLNSSLIPTGTEQVTFSVSLNF